MGQRANTATALLRQHGLQHRQHLVRRLSGSLVAHKVGQFVTTSVNGAHVAPQVVHQNLWRVRTAVHHRFWIIFVIALVITFIGHGVHEALHDSGVLDVVVHFHHFVFHIDLLEKTSLFGTCGCCHGTQTNAHGLLEWACRRLACNLCRHLAGRCALVDVGQEAGLLIRCVNLLQLAGALRIQRLLVECLLRLADVVQEVDVALLQRLSGLTQSTLLHAELAQLAAKSAEALSLLLANAKLLRGQRANALAKTLELLGLLAVNACCGLSGLVARLSLLHHQVGDVLVD